jgi:DNA (cytosine-5)-methyltransferase 1
VNVVRHLDLFSGIGGFALACRMVGGIETVAFCEREPYCQKVLAKHWPDVPICNDIHDLKGTEYGTVELITGGYPCQPFSYAGKREGENDDRHLWPELRRIIEAARPRWCLFENVAGHITLGLDQVLSDLDAIGYASAAAVVPACAVGSPQGRERVWIVANSQRAGLPEGIQHEVGTVLPHEMGGGCSWDETRSAWDGAPELHLLAHGLSAKLDQHATVALGNAIVPQVAAEIIRAMMQADRMCQ